MLVVWADGPHTIIPTCNDFEERLIKLLWRARPGFGTTPTPSSHPASYADSASGHSLIPATRGSAAPSERRVPLGRSTQGADATKENIEKALAKASNEPRAVRTVKHRWFGKRVVIEENRFPDPKDEIELGYTSEKRPTMLFAALYNGIAAGLSLGESPSSSQSHLLSSPPQHLLAMASVSIKFFIHLKCECNPSVKRLC